MAVASGRLRAPAFAAPTSRFRGRGAQALGILAILILGYILFKNEYSWPASITWDELPRKLDDAQTWLLDQRTEGSNPFFAVLDAFRAVLRLARDRAARPSSNGSPGSA
jgi:hypothetical protein